MFGNKMNIPLLGLFLCLLLAGCGVQQVQFVNAADPALPTKLGISDQDWIQIKQLASLRKEFVIKDTGKVAPNVIEVEFKRPDDLRNDQGGPTERYDKKESSWVMQSDFHGYWAVGKSSR